MILVDERLAKFNNSIPTLIGRMDEIDNHIEELEFVGDFDEPLRYANSSDLCYGQC